jgi:hypothetical protein
LKDGSLDPGDMDKILNLWWQKFSSVEIVAAQKEAEILDRLRPLYERLKQATEEEWEEYTRMLIHARLQSHGFSTRSYSFNLMEVSGSKRR